MPAPRYFLALFLPLGACQLAQAQAATTPSSPARAVAAAPSFSAASFAAAHDSLMLRVVRIRARAEARAAAFKASQGSLGGLHRRVITYAGVPQGAVNTVGFQTSSPIIKRQIIRHRFGVELEKVVYYGAYGHKILSERYEDHQLTRLELFEYSNYLNAIDASWLLVRGDYLRHVASLLLSASRSKQTAYFFGPRASGQ